MKASIHKRTHSNANPSDQLSNIEMKPARHSKANIIMTRHASPATNNSSIPSKHRSVFPNVVTHVTYLPTEPPTYLSTCLPAHVPASTHPPINRNQTPTSICTCTYHNTQKSTIDSTQSQETNFLLDLNKNPTEEIASIHSLSFRSKSSHRPIIIVSSANSKMGCVGEGQDRVARRSG